MPAAFVLTAIFFFLLGDAIGVDGIMSISHKMMGLFQNYDVIVSHELCRFDVQRVDIIDE